MADIPLCGSRKKRGDTTCARPAGWGTPHLGIGKCKLHGGSTPTHINAAHKAIAAQAVETYGLPRTVDPRDALLEEVHRTAGHVAWLADRIRELQPDVLIWGIKKRTVKTGSDQTDDDIDADHATVEEGPSIHVWLDLYHRERRHLVEVSKAAVAAGIEERRVRIAEQMGQQLASVIAAIVTDLGHKPTDPAVQQILVRHLSAVADVA